MVTRECLTRTAGEQEADWLLWCAVWRWYWELRTSLPVLAPPLTRESMGHGVEVILDDATAQGVLQADEAAFLRRWARVEALKAGRRRAKVLAGLLEQEERTIVRAIAANLTGTTMIRLPGGANIGLRDWVDDGVWTTVRNSRPTPPPQRQRRERGSRTRPGRR